MAMTKAERYLLVTLAKTLQKHFGDRDDFYWEIQVGLDELDREEERRSEFEAYIDQSFNPNE